MITPTEIISISFQRGTVDRPLRPEHLPPAKRSMRAPQPRYILLAVVLASLSAVTCSAAARAPGAPGASQVQHAPHTPKRVFLIRHGKSIWNESINLYENWRDSPLSETGITQCTDGYAAIRQNGLYRYLKKQHRDGKLKSFFSPLTRAAETILLMFGLLTNSRTSEILDFNLVALPDACERVSTSPNDGEGTEKCMLINRYASFAGRGLDKDLVLHRDGYTDHRVDTKADVDDDKISLWRSIRLARWRRRIERVVDLDQIPKERWWPQPCEACGDTGEVPCEKEDCAKGASFRGWHMHTCTKPCPRSEKHTFEWGLFRNKEKKSEVRQRIDSVMDEVMASKESDIVIAGHSHYFRQLIRDYLQVESGCDGDTKARQKRYSVEKMKNTQVLMIDFTGKRTECQNCDGTGQVPGRFYGTNPCEACEGRPGKKYVVNKIETVYRPDSPSGELLHQDTFKYYDNKKNS